MPYWDEMQYHDMCFEKNLVTQSQLGERASSTSEFIFRQTVIREAIDHPQTCWGSLNAEGTLAINHINDQRLAIMIHRARLCEAVLYKKKRD